MRSNSGGGQLTALAALAGLGLLLWSTLPISAQTSVTLVSNTGQTPVPGFGLDLGSQDFAQSFRTGTHSGGYRLTSAKASFTRLATGAIPSITASIRSGSSGLPGSNLGSLTNPGTWSTGENTFTAAGSGIYLRPNSTYWLLVDSGGATGSPLYFEFTNSEGENTAATGWSIANSAQFRTFNAVSWTSTPVKLLIAILGHETSAPATAPVSPDPSNLARSAVQWEPVGGMHSVPAQIGEISSNKPKEATASIDLSAIAASVREELRERSRGFYVTTLVESPGERRHILANLDRELARGSPLLKVSIWHVYRRASTGINTVELLGEVFLPRKVNLLVEPVEICLPAPSEDAERARVAVRGRTDQDWTILNTTLEDGQLCAETVRVSWFVIVLEAEPESEEAAA